MFLQTENVFTCLLFSDLSSGKREELLATIEECSSNTVLKLCFSYDSQKHESLIIYFFICIHIHLVIFVSEV